VYAAEEVIDVKKCSFLLLMVFFCACSNNEVSVQSSSYVEPTREELKSAMKYHGVCYAEQDDTGEWYFYRDGNRYRLFSYLEEQKTGPTRTRN